MENQQSPPTFPDGYSPSIILKFKDTVKLPYRDKLEEEIEQQQLGDWKAFAAQFPGLTISRLFGDAGMAGVSNLFGQPAVAAAAPNQPFPLPYFAIVCPPELPAAAVAKALSAWSAVDLAYAEPIILPAYLPTLDQNPLSPREHYLDAAPVGIDARYAWQIPGGLGTPPGELPLRLALVDFGCNVHHEDLTRVDPTPLAGENSATDSLRGHGTAVLSIAMGSDNRVGGVGVAPAVRGRVAFATLERERLSGDYTALLNAIVAAANWLTAVDSSHTGGHVLLIPLQISYEITNTDIHETIYPNLPVESDSIIRRIIMGITVRNITVVEPAGDGNNVGFELDRYRDRYAISVFDRNSTQRANTGAILVGAATSDLPLGNHHARTATSNYGTRVDCYAWGENITAAGNPFFPDDLRDYTVNFGGTSGASAMIAGAVLLIQSMAISSHGRAFTPQQLQAILRNPATGTASANPSVDRVGLMPNLRAIIETNGLRRVPSQFEVERDFRFRYLVGILFGITYDGPGRIIFPGGGIGTGEPFPVAWSPAKRDMIAGLALRDVAPLISTSAGQEAVRNAGMDIMQAALKTMQATDALTGEIEQKTS